jgi:hypothetical protein
MFNERRRDAAGPALGEAQVGKMLQQTALLK